MFVIFHHWITGFTNCKLMETYTLALTRKALISSNNRVWRVLISVLSHNLRKIFVKRQNLWKWTQIGISVLVCFRQCIKHPHTPSPLSSAFYLWSFKFSKASSCPKNSKIKHKACGGNSNDYTVDINVW